MTFISPLWEEEEEEEGREVKMKSFSGENLSPVKCRENEAGGLVGRRAE